MAICPKCGKEVPDGATFCGACGAQMSADGVSSASSASFCPKCGESVPAGAAACPKCGAALNAEPEKKGFQAPPKKTLMIGGAAVVVVIAAAAAFSMLSGGGSGADYGLYLKDDQLVYTTLKEEGDWDVTSDLADGEEVTASDAFELSLLVTMSEDGKRIFFPDRGGDAIYYRETGDPEGEAVRVDTDMSDYAINASGTLVTYLKDSDLYQSDLTDKERIASDVEAFWVTNDGKTVTYFNTDDGYYRWTSGGESEKLVSNITNIEYVSDDLSEVLYVKDGSLYRQTGTEEPVKITSDVENVVRILDSGELYYTKSASDDLSVMDYIEDDLASSDAAMQPVEYPDYVWSFEYDTTEAYEAAKAQRDQQMEAYNAYRDKLDRDEMREELKESTISQNRYELYYYNGTEETLVTDSLAYGSLTASAADKAVAVIEVRDEASASKVKISEIEYAYEAESRVREMLNTGTQYYVVSGSTMVPMETDDPQSFRIDGAGETIYYVDNVSEEGDTGDLYKVTFDGSALGTPEEYDLDVSTYSLSLYDSGDLIYYKNVKGNEGDLYLNGQEVDYSIYSYQYMEDSGRLLYLSDWNSEDQYGTLRLYEDGEASTIAEDVHDMELTLNDAILYLSDFSSNHQVGTLYLYSGSEPVKLDDDVTAIVFTYDRWSETGYQSGGSINYYEEDESEYDSSSSGSGSSSASSDYDYYDWLLDYYYGLY